MIDKDLYKPGAPEAWAELVERLGQLPETRRAITPQGGEHLVFAWPGGDFTHVPKLAEGVDVRGRGHYVVVAPSANGNGRAYRWTNDLDPAELPEAWLEALRRPTSQVSDSRHLPTGGNTDDLRPGDIFNARTTWTSLLGPLGWRPLRVAGDGNEHWCRPGKDEATTGATVSQAGTGVLYVFSTDAAPFVAGEHYDRFGAYATLHHQGDRTAAARDLRQLGFSSPRPETHLNHASEPSWIRDSEDDPGDDAGQDWEPPDEPEPDQGSKQEYHGEGGRTATGSEKPPDATWRPRDLGPVIEGLLSGTIKTPTPTIGCRSDSAALFYPGRVNTVAGESGGGKSWLAQHVAAQEVGAGHHVVFIDFEDNDVGVVGRLLDLGVPSNVVSERFHYLTRRAGHVPVRDHHHWQRQRCPQGRDGGQGSFDRPGCSIQGGRAPHHARAAPGPVDPSLGGGYRCRHCGLRQARRNPPGPRGEGARCPGQGDARCHHRPGQGVDGPGPGGVRAAAAIAAAQQRVATAHDAVTRATERLNAATKPTQAMADAVAKAHDKETAAGQKLQDVESKYAGTANTSSAASGRLQAAQDKVSAAQAKLTSLTAIGAAGGLDAAKSHLKQVEALAKSTGQSQQLQLAQEAVAKATQKATETQDAANKATDAAQHPLKAYEANLKSVEGRIHGQAEAQAETFGGRFEAMKTTVLNMAQNLGAKYGPALMGVSAAVTIVGSATDATASIIKHFSKVGEEAGQAAEGMGKAGQAAADGSKLVKVAKEAETVATLATLATTGATEAATPALVAEGAAGTAAGAGMLAAIAPAALIVGALVAVGVAAYELVTHWKEVTHALVAAWHWVAHEATQIWNGMTKGVLHGIDDTINFVKGISGKVIGALGDAGSWLLNAGKDVVGGLIHGIEGAAGDVLHALENLIPSPLRGTLSFIFGQSPSPMFTGFGKNWVDGLSVGLVAGKGQLHANMRDLAKGMTAPFPVPGASVGAMSGGSSIPLQSGAGGAAGPSRGSQGPQVVNITVNVPSGFVGSPTELVDTIHQGLLAKGARTGSLFGGAAPGTGSGYA